MVFPLLVVALAVFGARHATPRRALRGGLLSVGVLSLAGCLVAANADGTFLGIVWEPGRFLCDAPSGMAVHRRRARGAGRAACRGTDVADVHQCHRRGPDTGLLRVPEGGPVPDRVRSPRRSVRCSSWRRRPLRQRVICVGARWFGPATSRTAGTSGTGHPWCSLGWAASSRGGRSPRSGRRRIPSPCSRIGRSSSASAARRTHRPDVGCRSPWSWRCRRTARRRGVIRGVRPHRLDVRGGDRGVGRRRQRAHRGMYERGHL